MPAIESRLAADTSKYLAHYTMSPALKIWFIGMTHHISSINGKEKMERDIRDIFSLGLTIHYLHSNDFRITKWGFVISIEISGLQGTSQLQGNAIRLMILCPDIL